jgi:hypothetical protein
MWPSLSPTAVTSNELPSPPIHVKDEEERDALEQQPRMAIFVEHLFIASTHAYLMIFTDDGMVYKIKVHEVPDAAASARGKAVVNLINIPSDRRLAGVVPVKEFSEGRFVVMVTRKGVIKKTSLADFQNIRSNGNHRNQCRLIFLNFRQGVKIMRIHTFDLYGASPPRLYQRTHPYVGGPGFKYRHLALLPPITLYSP